MPRGCGARETRWELFANNPGRKRQRMLTARRGRRLFAPRREFKMGSEEHDQTRAPSGLAPLHQNPTFNCATSLRPTKGLRAFFAPEVQLVRSVWSYRPYRVAYPLVAAAIALIYAFVVPVLPIYLFGVTNISGGPLPAPSPTFSQLAFASGLGLLLPLVLLGSLGLVRCSRSAEKRAVPSYRVSGQVVGALFTGFVPSLTSTLVGCTSSLTIGLAEAGAAALAPALGQFLGTYAWGFFGLSFLILWFAARRLGHQWEGCSFPG